MELFDVLRKAFNDEGKVDGDEIAFFCPQHFHKKRKLYINKKSYKYHCWVCDLSGHGIRSLFKKLNLDVSLLEGILLEDSNTENFLSNTADDELQQIVSLPREYEPLCYKRKSKLYEACLLYLRNRNISDVDILQYKIGYCEYGDFRGRAIFPSFDKEGKLNYFLGRTFTNHPMKYKNATLKKNQIIFNELYVDFATDVILCEGIFDSIVCGKNSIPLLGSSISNKLIDSLRPNSSVILAIDPDTYHFDDDKKSKIINLSKKLKKYTINSFFLDVRPFKDAGEMTKSEFAKRKENLVEINDEFIFRAKMGEIN